MDSPKLVLALLCLFFASYGEASNMHHGNHMDENEMMEDLQAVLRSVHPEVAVDGTGCDCIGYNCGCCVYMDLPEIYLDDTVCVNISYLPDDLGVSVTMTVDDYTIFNETVSARNPPPICAAVPYLKDEVSLCLVFYDLDVSNASFSGCIKIEVRLFSVLKEDYDLGCFHIGGLLHDSPAGSKKATAVNAMLKRVVSNLQQASNERRMATYKFKPVVRST